MRVLPGENFAAVTALVLSLGLLAGIKGSVSSTAGGSAILDFLSFIWIPAAVAGAYAVLPALWRLSHPREI